MMAFLDDYDDGNTLSCSVFCTTAVYFRTVVDSIYNIQVGCCCWLICLSWLAGWLLLLLKYKTSCARETDMGRSES